MSRPMSPRTLQILPALVLLLAAPLAPARADVLLIERVQAAQAKDLPARGLSMEQVQARWGTPQAQMEPRGGQKPQWPVINRWNYPEFTVYFERDRVIDAVLSKAAAEETGPKPTQ